MRVGLWRGISCWRCRCWLGRIGVWWVGVFCGRCWRGGFGSRGIRCLCWWGIRWWAGCARGMLAWYAQRMRVDRVLQVVGLRQASAGGVVVELAASVGLEAVARFVVEEESAPRLGERVGVSYGWPVVAVGGSDQVPLGASGAGA